MAQTLSQVPRKHNTFAKHRYGSESQRRNDVAGDCAVFCGFVSLQPRPSLIHKDSTAPHLYWLCFLSWMILLQVLIDSMPAYSWTRFARLSFCSDLLRRIGTRSEGRTIITDSNTDRTFVPGEINTARTIYSLVSLLCAVLLAVLFRFRAKTLKNNAFRKFNATSIVICTLFLLAISFITSATVVEVGQGLSTQRLCYSAAIICLVFYTGNKLAIYAFLLERARVVRAPFTSRLKDWIWVAGMTIFLGGFGTIAIIGYVSPIVDLSMIDGRCRIGLPPQVSFPLLSFDIGVNIALTGVFIYLLRPVLDTSRVWTFSAIKSTRIASMSRRMSRRRTPAALLPQQRVINNIIKTLLWKSMWGSVLIMLPTAGNMAQFYIMKGRELGWICLTICTLDVTWGVIVINWLTMSCVQDEKNLMQSTLTMREEQEPPHSSPPRPLPSESTSNLTFVTKRLDTARTQGTS